MKKDDEYFLKSATSQKLKRLCPLISIGNYNVYIWDVHWVKYSTRRNRYHSHDMVEIHVPFKGEGIVKTRGESREFKPGFFTISPPGQEHAWDPVQSSTEMQVWWLLFERVAKTPDDGGYAAEDICKLFLQADRLVYELPNLFYALFDYICHELENPSVCSEAIAVASVKQIVMLFAESLSRIHGSCGRAAPPPRSALIRKSDASLVMEIDGYISENLHRQLSLDGIAKKFNLNARTMTRRYKRRKGQSIWATMLEMRMACAKALLEQTGLSISEIARRAGFNNKSYFSNAFRKAFNTTPSQLRARQG